MASSIISLNFDETSNLWIQPFSVIINCMFPVEYVYGEWYWWQETTKAKHSDPESLGSSRPNDIESGSRAEGFCIPQFLLSKSDVDPFAERLDEKEHWQPDLDVMSELDYFVENEEESVIPIFIVEHAADDSRYAKLRLTNEWKEYRPRYKNTSFLHHAFLLPSGRNLIMKMENERAESSKWSYDVHGPVRKLQSKGFPSYESDQTGVFKYPIAWPESAMEWLIRSRPSGWPSPALVQEIFEGSCHLAPVGRGKRLDEPFELLQYLKNLDSGGTSDTPKDERCEGNIFMDETEWRISFSVAENKLGQSLPPVQRHVIVLLKMIMKLYFPEVISSYYLKNLLFWECENREESFWREDNSAKCLLTMMDRLQESLEERRLPHYIIPQSNLLQYEDPVQLAEAAAIVADVRRNILPKTVSLLKRLQSLTYLSNTFLEDLELETYLLNIQDDSLPEKETRKLLCSLHSIFIRKCKDVIASLRSQMDDPGEKVQKLMTIPLHAYQSLLARNLCKLWFLKSYENSDDNTNEKEFTLYIKDEARNHSLGDEFIDLSLVFFGEMKKGKDPSQVVPGTSVMEHIKETQRTLAYGIVQEATAPIKEMFGCLHTNDVLIESVVKRVANKLKGTPVATITMEDIVRMAKIEIAGLFEDTHFLTDSGEGPSN